MMIDFDFAGTIRGFMDKAEAEKLYDIALDAARAGPVLEIGSYCGKSAYIIGTACQIQGGILFSVDHHRGSPEQQKGEEYFDEALFNEKAGIVDTFPVFRETIENAALSGTVVPLVAESAAAGRMWETPLSMVFIDGGHAYEDVWTDYTVWAKHIRTHGFLVMHDIFLDPADGGQAPRRVWDQARESGMWEDLGLTGSLAVLRRF